MRPTYTEGRNAYRANKTIDENPYTIGSDDWQAWRDGWSKAQKDTSERPLDQDEKCRNCSNWIPDETKSAGECRAVPPSVVRVKTAVGYTNDRAWPVVFGHDWCFNFRGIGGIKRGPK